MTKSELVESIAARGEVSKARAEAVINCLFDTMIEAIRTGEGVEIRGFGSFSARTHKEYQGRNPRTGKLVTVPAKVRPFFRVGNELRELVNASRDIGSIQDFSESDNV